MPYLYFPGGSDSKASACNAGDQGSIPGSGRSPGEGNGNPLQYPWLENPMDRGAWQATVHGVAKSRTWLSDFTFTFLLDSTYMWYHVMIHFLDQCWYSNCRELSASIALILPPLRGDLTVACEHHWAQLCSLCAQVPAGVFRIRHGTQGPQCLWQQGRGAVLVKQQTLTLSQRKSIGRVGVPPIIQGFPGSSVVKKSTCQYTRYGFNPWVRRIPWRRKWQPTPMFLPGKSQGQRHLAGYCPWDHKESDMT